METAKPKTSIDVIVTWPRNCDYPLWREFMRKNRSRFRSVFVVFMETNSGPDFRTFVKKAMEADAINFLEIDYQFAGQDWRDAAIKTALHFSDAEWIWFTEQDFFIHEPENFWQFVSIFTTHEFNEAITYYESERMHPCCLFLKREFVQNFKLDFSAKPPEYDHFGAVQIIMKTGRHLDYPVSHEWVHHMAGLSHNFHLITNGEKPVYKPEEFQIYLNQCLSANVPQDTQFVEIAHKYLETVK